MKLHAWFTVTCFVALFIMLSLLGIQASHRPPVLNDQTPFESFSIALTPYPNEAHPVLNTRNFKFSLLNAKEALPSGKEFSIKALLGIFAHSDTIDCVMGASSTPMLTVFKNTNDITITLPLDIDQGQDLTFRCNAGSIFFDFRKATGQWISISFKSAGGTYTIIDFILDPIDDATPERASVFEEFEVDLTRPPASINLRDFTLVGTRLLSELNSSLIVSLPRPILSHPIPQTVIECSWGTDVKLVPTNVSETGFTLDFSDHPIAALTERLQITCRNLLFDFSPALGLEIPLRIETNANPVKSNIASVGPVRDQDSAVEWPMTLTMPLRAQFQPFVTLNIDNIPSREETNVDELGFALGVYGLKIRNTPSASGSLLHRLTLTSYASVESNTPVYTRFPVEIADHGFVTAPTTLKFPSNHVKLSASFQIATVSTEKTVSVGRFDVESSFTGKSYKPDYKKTPSAWDYSLPGFDLSGKNQIMMTFGEYIGDKTNPLTYGPTFSIAFPKTLVALANSGMTLRTNLAIPIAETTSAFHFIGAKSDQYLQGSAVKEECFIPQFNAHVPVRRDEFSQQLSFDLNGIKQFEKSGAAFVLQCPNYAIIAPNKDSTVAFTIDGVQENQALYSASWVTTISPQKSPGHGFLISCIIAIIVIAAIGVWVACKKGLFGKKDVEKQQLIGANPDSFIQ